jgi:hypothetical protein
MPGLGSTAASLGFAGDDLDPAEITRLVGYEPSFAGRKGEPRRSASTSREFAPYRTGLWTLRAPNREPGDLDAQIRELLASVTDNPETWKRLKRYEPHIFCGLFMKETNEGEVITVSTLKMLADRGIEMQFDIYAPDQQDQAQQS